MKTLLRLFQALIFFAPIAFLPAAEPTVADQETRALSALREAGATVKTVSSSFVQEKHLSIFDEVIVSKGRFCFQKPDHILWETTEPIRSGFSIKGNRGKRWHAHMDGIESFDVSRVPMLRGVVEQLLAWATDDVDRLKRMYRIQVLSESPISLRLEPIDSMARGVVDHLLAVFSADARHVSSVEVHEVDGDFTRIAFVETSINVPLPEDFP